MAIKDVLAFVENSSTQITRFIDIVTGAEIRTHQFGQDFGHAWKQNTDDSFFEFDFDIAQIRKFDKDFNLLWENAYKSINAGSLSGKHAVAADGKIYFSYQNTVIRFVNSAGAYNQSAGTLIDTSDPLMPSNGVGGFNKITIGMVNGVETIFGFNDGGTSLYVAALADAGDTANWVEHDVSTVLAGINYCVAIGNRLMITSNSILTGGKIFFVADMSAGFTGAASFDAGQTTTDDEEGQFYGTGDSSSIQVSGNSFEVKSQSDTYLAKFDVVTKTYTKVSFTLPLDFTSGNTKWTVSDLNDMTFASTGEIVASCLYDGDVSGALGITVRSLILLNSTGTTMIKELWRAPSGTSAIQGIKCLQFTHHSISGTVTASAVPVENALVGILGSNGEINIRTKTKADGTYALPCYSAADRQVVAYDTNGNSQVHLVTPVATV